MNQPSHFCNGKNVQLNNPESFKLKHANGVTKNVELHRCPVCNNKFMCFSRYMELKMKNNYSNYTFEMTPKLREKELAQRLANTNAQNTTKVVKELIPGSTITIVDQPYHICNGRSVQLNSPELFKLRHANGVTKNVELQRCPVCNNKFMYFSRYTELKMKNNYSNYTFEMTPKLRQKELEYKLERKNVESAKNINAKIIKQGTIIYKDNNYKHDCINEIYNFVDFKGQLEDDNGVKNIFSFRKCNSCEKIFMKIKSYNKASKRYKKYKFVSLKSEQKSKPQKKNYVSSTVVEKNNYTSRTIVEKNNYISPNDFLTRSNTFYCTNEKHKLVDITAEIKILNSDGKLIIVEFPAAKCNDCDKYYVLESEYQKLKQKGILICKVVEKEFWNDSLKNDTYNLNKESLLHIFGYNVNSQVGLSNTQRWTILELIVDEQILSKIEICSHLDYLINRSKSRTSMSTAVTKWKLDKEHIRNYNSSTKKVEVETIKRNIYR